MSGRVWARRCGGEWWEGGRRGGQWPSGGGSRGWWPEALGREGERGRGRKGGWLILMKNEQVFDFVSTTHTRITIKTRRMVIRLLSHIPFIYSQTCAVFIFWIAYR